MSEKINPELIELAVERVNPEGSDIEFWTKLIKVSVYHGEEISRNCTHVAGDYWIFEGDEECLDSTFEILAEGAVPSLGGMTQAQLIELCDEVFGVEIPK